MKDVRNNGSKATSGKNTKIFYTIGLRARDVGDVGSEESNSSSLFCDSHLMFIIYTSVGWKDSRCFLFPEFK